MLYVCQIWSTKHHVVAVQLPCLNDVLWYKYKCTIKVSALKLWQEQTLDLLAPPHTVTAIFFLIIIIIIIRLKSYLINVLNLLVGIN